jgi:hypothetical protein
MKLSLDQKIAVSLLVFLIVCLLVFWALLEKPVQTPEGAEGSPESALKFCRWHLMALRFRVSLG